MKVINLETWPRRSQFEHFLGHRDPRSSALVNLDVTSLRAACEARRHSFYYAVLFRVAHAVNSVPELRQRIRGETVVEHEQVGVTFTTFDADTNLNYCRLPEVPEDFATFFAACRRLQQGVREHQRGVIPDPPTDALVWTSYIPWFSPTSIKEPLQGPETWSIPQIMMARDFDQGGQRLIPVSLTTHHGLVDGRHVGTFFRRLQQSLTTSDDGASDRSH